MLEPEEIDQERHQSEGSGEKGGWNSLRFCLRSSHITRGPGQGEGGQVSLLSAEMGLQK